MPGVVRWFAAILLVALLVLDGWHPTEMHRRYIAYRANTKVSPRILETYVLETAVVFDKHNITYWVDYSTLLGALRDGGPMPGDYDGDMMLLGDEREMKRAFLALKAELPTQLRVEVCYLPQSSQVSVVCSSHRRCHGAVAICWYDLLIRVDGHLGIKWY